MSNMQHQMREAVRAPAKSENVGMQEAYTQLRELREEIARVRQVRLEVDNSSSEDEEGEDEGISY